MSYHPISFICNRNYANRFINVIYVNFLFFSFEFLNKWRHILRHKGRRIIFKCPYLHACSCSDSLKISKIVEIVTGWQKSLKCKYSTAWNHVTSSFKKLFKKSDMPPFTCSIIRYQISLIGSQNIAFMYTHHHATSSSSLWFYLVRLYSCFGRPLVLAFIYDDCGSFRQCKGGQGYLPEPKSSTITCWYIISSSQQ